MSSAGPEIMVVEAAGERIRSLGKIAAPDRRTALLIWAQFNRVELLGYDLMLVCSDDGQNHGIRHGSVSFDYGDGLEVLVPNEHIWALDGCSIDRPGRDRHKDDTAMLAISNPNYSEPDKSAWQNGILGIRRDEPSTIGAVSTVHKIEFLI